MALVPASEALVPSEPHHSQHPWPDSDGGRRPAPLANSTSRELAFAARSSKLPANTYYRCQVVDGQNVTKIIVPYVVGHLPCPYECGRSFKHATQRILHVRKVHTGARPFVCNEPGCGKTFHGSASHKQHLRVHMAVPPGQVKCEQCGKMLASLSSLAYHTKALHSLERKFKCMREGCGVTYMTKKDIDGHEAKHVRMEEKEKLKEETKLQSKVMKLEKKVAELQEKLQNERRKHEKEVRRRHVVHGVFVPIPVQLAAVYGPNTVATFVCSPEDKLKHFTKWNKPFAGPVLVSKEPVPKKPPRKKRAYKKRAKTAPAADATSTLATVHAEVVEEVAAVAAPVAAVPTVPSGEPVPVTAAGSAEPERTATRSTTREVDATDSTPAAATAAAATAATTAAAVAVAVVAVAMPAVTNGGTIPPPAKRRRKVCPPRSAVDQEKSKRHLAILGRLKEHFATKDFKDKVLFSTYRRGLSDDQVKELTAGMPRPEEVPADFVPPPPQPARARVVGEPSSKAGITNFRPGGVKAVIQLE